MRPPQSSSVPDSPSLARDRNRISSSPSRISPSSSRATRSIAAGSFARLSPLWTRESVRAIRESILTIVASRWSVSYATRLALVLQPRTPQPVALLQISSLVPRDLRRVAEAHELRPLVRAAAAAVLERGAAATLPNSRRLN